MRGTDRRKEAKENLPRHTKETLAVRRALEEAGIKARVGHKRYYTPGLEIHITDAAKRSEALRIAQRITAREISVHVHEGGR